MTLNHLLDRRLLRTARVPGRSQASVPSSGLGLHIRGKSRAVVLCHEERFQEVLLSGSLGVKFGAPHSTLPGFMRPRGSSTALSCHMISIPTVPTSSCSSCRLPSPMPCSPVHVPRSASARLGGSREELLSRVLLPLPSDHPPPPPP